MSFDLSQRIRVSSKHANIDERYGPYTSVTAALVANSLASRAQGRVFGIIENGKVVDYWFPTSDVTDSALEKKKEGGVSYITTIFKSATMSDIGAEESETEEAITQKLATWIENQNFVIPEGEIWAFELEREGTDDNSDKLSKIATSSQSVESQVVFKKDISVGGWYYWGDKNRNILYSGVSATIPNATNIAGEAFAFGSNLFPNFNLKKENEDAYNRRFLGIGDTIFPNYTGNSNYRPSHNAHDSWVGVGFGLGKGMEDGTNITMIGTGNMHRNDVKYADSVTVVGKGNTSGYPLGQDPNRVINAVNGFSVRDMMTDVVMIGHENWVGAINNSTVLGSNLRSWKYVFNSIVLGHHTFNYNTSGTQSNAFLDSDIILGNGIYKRLDRHKESHNLLIGMDYTYVTGTPPDYTYRPLIEGNFKKDKASLQVNGQLIAGHAKENEDLPEHENLNIQPLSSIPGITFSENKITVGQGAPASGSLYFTPLAKNNDLVYNTKMKPILVTAGSYGGKINNVPDSDNRDTSFTWNLSYQILTTSPDANTELIFTWADGFQGVIELTIKSINIVNNTGVKPVLAFKSGAEEVTFEARSGSNPTKHIAFGKDTGKMLFLGTTSNFFGTNTYTKAVSASQVVMFGSNIATNVVDSNRTVVVGSNILTNTTKVPSLSVLIGNNILNNADVERPFSAVIIGADTCINTKKVEESVIIGRTVLINQRESTRDVIIGSISSPFNTTTDCTIVGARSFTDGRYNSVDARNLTTLGARDFVSPVGYNNITVIGNNETTDTFLHGNVRANAFVVNNVNPNNLLRADGQTVPLGNITPRAYTLDNDSNLVSAILNSFNNPTTKVAEIGRVQGYNIKVGDVYFDEVSQILYQGIGSNRMVKIVL